MKNKLKKLSVCSLFSLILLATQVFTAETYTVVSGDSLWKIAVKYQIGLSERISANPQISNLSLIYPGQKINIPQNDEYVLSFEKEVVRLVNEICTKSRMKTLSEDWELSRVARYKSHDMKNNGYFSHNSLTYGTPFEMMKNFDIKYKTSAENIAKGQQTPQAVVNAWMNLAGHRANILNTQFTKIGVDYVKSGNYWTQMFMG